MCDLRIPGAAAERHYPDARFSRYTPVIFLSLLLIGSFCVGSISARAQGDTTSSIFGQVTDATSAAIPGATISVANRETGLQRTAKTDQEGRFNFAQLPPGVYSVKAEADGFE